ncbi:hypothetical protein AB1L30_27385 [Bremerella sp. JC817]|uniref:hypothetical protein n=1 Tax=Bremerella sp. JC817 TaxID=3231756 RepID=UPI0034579455
MKGTGNYCGAMMTWVTKLNCLVGVVAVWQVFLALLIVLEQLYWTTFDPVVVFTSENAMYQRCAVYDYEQTMLLLVSSGFAMGALLSNAETQLQTRFATTSLVFAGLFWLCFIATVFHPYSPHRFSGRLPEMDIAGYSLYPDETTELEIRFRADPLAHASLWAGLGQLFLSVALFIPSLRQRKLRLLDLFVCVAMLAIAFSLWGALYKPPSIPP